jgi:hypothetical protein
VVRHGGRRGDAHGDVDAHLQRNQDSIRQEKWKSIRHIGIWGGGGLGQELIVDDDSDSVYVFNKARDARGSLYWFFFLWEISARNKLLGC